jgi:uncharacterized membrane protein YvlD (DUF360 family)
MSPSNFSGPERLIEGCFSLLAAAVALYLAARLIEAVWPVLLVLAASIGAVVGIVVWLRWNRQGW